MADAIDSHDPIPQLLVDNVPSVEKPRGRDHVSYTKADITKDLFNRDNVTDGQTIMAKMLVNFSKDVNPRDYSVDELKAMSRKPGYAIAFSERKGDLSRSLFNEGMIVFSSAIENTNKTAFVAVDKDGVFLIQDGPKSEGDKFLQSMRNRFEMIGDQEENVVVDELAEPNARKWDPEYNTIVPLDAETAEKAIKLASEESTKAPFISSADYELQTKRTNPKPVETIPSKTKVKLSEIDF